MPALQSLHLGAEQMQDLMPAGKPAAKKSSKAKADVRPAVFLPPELDNDEPFVPPLAALKRCCTHHTVLLVSCPHSASSRLLQDGPQPVSGTTSSVPEQLCCSALVLSAISSSLYQNFQVGGRPRSEEDFSASPYLQSDPHLLLGWPQG